MFKKENFQNIKFKNTKLLKIYKINLKNAIIYKKSKVFPRNL